VWGTISGYTQNQTSQIMAYPPGAVVTITNLSSTSPHTLNVIGVTNGPPANWPQNPSLSFYPSGNGVLGSNYASGTINAGASVKVKLKNPGIYLIGCAFHYIEFSMRAIIEVSASATPGPTASPGPGGYASPAPTARPRTIGKQPTLIDQNGRHFALSSLRGEPLVMTFVAAHCTDACPLINAQFAQAAQVMQHEHLRGRLLTITLDPEHDSPATMRHLATRFQANRRYWLLASGSRADVHNVMHAFGVVSVEGKDGYRDQHTTFVYVFDPAGRLVRTTLASTALNDEIVEGLRSRHCMTRT
jgi:protein SCO1/2